MLRKWMFWAWEPLTQVVDCAGEWNSSVGGRKGGREEGGRERVREHGKEMETVLFWFFHVLAQGFNFPLSFFVVVSFAHPEVSPPLKVPHIQPTHTHTRVLAHKHVFLTYFLTMLCVCACIYICVIVTQFARSLKRNSFLTLKAIVCARVCVYTMG